MWLVDERGLVQRTFKVRPGSLDPLPGVYWVTSRSNATTGSDGAPIEHVVRFTAVEGVRWASARPWPSPRGHRTPR